MNYNHSVFIGLFELQRRDYAKQILGFSVVHTVHFVFSTRDYKQTSSMHTFA
jgi:hypothetical protein